jgi:hypothetical protein
MQHNENMDLSNINQNLPTFETLPIEAKYSSENKENYLQQYLPPPL